MENKTSGINKKILSFQQDFQIRRLTDPFQPQESTSSIHELLTEDLIATIKTPATEKKIRTYFAESERAIEEESNYEKAEESLHRALGLASRTKDYDNLIEGMKRLGELYQTRTQIRKEAPEPGTISVKDPGQSIQAIMCYNSALNLVRDPKTNPQITDPEEQGASLIERIVASEMMFVSEVKERNQSESIEIYLRYLSEEKEQGCGRYVERVERDKAELEKIREYSRQCLKGIKHLAYKRPEDNRAVEIEKLFNEIREQIKVFLQRLIKECETILGTPPCRYSVIAFGSLARGEMTPYSDLEFGILIEDKERESRVQGLVEVEEEDEGEEVGQVVSEREERRGREVEELGGEEEGINERNKVYFRDLTRLLQIRVTNLGETRIRGSRTEMPELDDYFSMMRQEGFWFDPTVKGFTFDPGEKTPLGKPPHIIDKSGKFHSINEQIPESRIKKRYPGYELIGTPAEIGRMVSEEVKEMDKHLPIVVHNGWLVYSYEQVEDRELFGQEKQLIQEYQNAVQNELRREQRIRVQTRVKSEAETEEIEGENKNPIRVQMEGIPLYRERALELMAENIKRYDPRLEEIDKEGKGFRTKDEIYRLATILIDNLALYYGITGGTTYEKVESLAEDLEEQDYEGEKDNPSLFNREAVKNLKVAVAIANELRLRTYLENRGQKENMVARLPYEVGNRRKTVAKGIFYLEDLEPVFQFYYRILPLYEQIKAFESGVRERAIVGKDLYDAGDLNRGIIHKRLLEYKKAKQCFRLAIKEGDEGYFVLSLLAYVCVQLGEYEKAIQCLEVEFRIETTIFSENHIFLARTWSNLGSVYQTTGSYEKSIWHYIKSIEIKINILGEENIEVAWTLMNLGTAYHDQGKHLKSLDCYKKAEGIISASESKNIYRMVYIYFNIGLVYKDQGKYVEAIDNYKKGLCITIEIFGSYHIEVARLLNSIGAVYLDTRDFDGAMTFFKKALEITIATFSDSHIEIASIWTNIGTLFQILGKYKDALIIFQKAKRITIDTLGEHNIQVATCLGNIGNLYHDQGNYDKALKYNQRAIKIIINIFGEYHFQAGKVWNNIGLVYGTQGKHAESLVCYSKAIRIKIATFGKTHIQVARTWNNMGLAYAAQDKYYKAIECYEKAMKILIANSGEEDFEAARIWNNKGLVYKELGLYCKALRCYEKDLRITIAILGAHHIEVGMTLGNIGNVYYAQGRYSDALNYYRKELEIKIAKLGEHHVRVGTTYFNIGLLYKEQNYQLTALSYYRKTLRIYEQSLLPDDNPNMQKVKIAIKRLKQSIQLDPDLIQHILMAIKDEPSKAVHVATYLLIQNRDQQAVDLYIQVINQDASQIKQLPVSFQLLEILANRFLMFEGKPEIAIKLYERNLEQYPEETTIYHNLACAYQAIENHTKADENFRKGIEYLETRSIQAEYAMFLVVQERYKEGLLHCLRAIEIEDESGLGYRRSERETVIPELQREIDQFGEIEIQANILAYRLLIIAHLQLGNKDEAMAAVMMLAIEIGESKNALYHSILGNAYKELQMYGKAVIAYRRALELNPGYDLAKENLMIVMSLEGEGEEEG